MDIKSLIQKAIEKQATDVHLVVDRPPIFRVHGELHPSDLPVITKQGLQDFLMSFLTEKQKEKFLNSKEIDFSYLLLEGYQLRINIHFEKGNIASTIRISPTKLKSAEELLLPFALKDLAKKRKGFVILSGATGSGKSTTMSYFVDLINRERKSKIVTIEDPIEFVHTSKQSLIIQREVGNDTESFQTALKYALRQDPDVIVVGEIRDLESISMALTAAETGHLVITTLHAADAIETINRIIDACTAAKQDQIRTQLAENLIAVIHQVLLPKKDVPGRVLATEVLLVTMPIRNLIRRNSLVEIRGQMDNQPASGMHTLEYCLSELVKNGQITAETAREYAKYPNYLRLENIPDPANG